MLRQKLHFAPAGFGHRHELAGIVDAADESAHLQQVRGHQRQAVQRKGAADVLEHLPSVPVTPQRLGGIDATRPDGCEIVLPH
ncbi:MAG: hypothetical protein ABI563_02430 [Specibacter sp.]